MDQIRPRPAEERGQTTVALAGVVVALMLGGIGVSLIAEAIVHRSRASGAADAVALASVRSLDAASELGVWYAEQGVGIEASDGHAFATSGPSQAEAWAELGRVASQPAPVLVAVVARAEQLTGTTFTAPRLRGMRVELAEHDALAMATVAAELGLCPVADLDVSVGSHTFEIC